MMIALIWDEQIPNKAKRTISAGQAQHQEKHVCLLIVCTRVCAEWHFIVDFIALKRGGAVCPARLAQHAQQIRQSMPSRTGKACSAKQAKHGQQDRQTMLSRTDNSCSADQAKHGQQGLPGT